MKIYLNILNFKLCYLVNRNSFLSRLFFNLNKNHYLNDSKNIKLLYINKLQKTYAKKLIQRQFYFIKYSLYYCKKILPYIQNQS